MCKDANGVELRVGDKVIYTSVYGIEQKGKITRILNEKYINIQTAPSILTVKSTRTRISH